MAEIVRMQSVESVLNGVLKIVWRDGFAGVVDLRSILARGDMFAFLRNDPARFATVALEEYGHKIFWLDDDGDEIDFGSSSLRERAERQAEILRLAS
ncbi:MAG: hypothetical protein ACRC7G_09135 [Beijerinckiaceae bacterium]